MKCPNCGRDLLEGEICTCTTVEQDAQTTAQAQPENEVQPETEAPIETAEQPQPENTYYQPPTQPKMNIKIHLTAISSMHSRSVRHSRIITTRLSKRLITILLCQRLLR